MCKTDYSAVLNNIAKGITDKLGCELTYPTSAESDPTKLAVSLTPKGGTPQVLTQVTDVSKCGFVSNRGRFSARVAGSRSCSTPSCSLSRWGSIPK